MKKISAALFVVSLFLSLDLMAAGSDGLQDCWERQVKPLQGKFLMFSYEEKLSELYHSPEPWQQLHYTGKGNVWLNGDRFLKMDTLDIGRRKYGSKTMLSKDELLFLDYGDKDLSAITPEKLSQQLIQTARYTPVLLVSYFAGKDISQSTRYDKEYRIYETMIHNTAVTLFIRRTDGLPGAILILENDDLRGDVESRFEYSGYNAGSMYPRTITITKMNGKISDTVSIDSMAVVDDAPALLEKPADYAVRDKEEKVRTITTQNYSENIWFLDLMPEGARTLVVVFRDFVLVEGASQDSRNGERIINEVKKVAPGKPVKYFLFGHHHPDYLGGMRAFVHKGVTILAVPDNKDYLSFLAGAAHTLKPDSLQLQPRPLKTEDIRDSITITDGDYRMHIYHIGKRSGHTSDYLVYYFPKEKMLFEDDLVWIKKEGAPQKAGATQSGLYNAVKDLKLDIKEIVQSWGIGFDAYKTIIPFEELEASMKVN